LTDVWRAPPRSARAGLAAITSLSGEDLYVFDRRYFGVGTLFATVLLLIMQIVDDFRSA
jgi:hypothetical protein